MFFYNEHVTARHWISSRGHEIRERYQLKTVLTQLWREEEECVCQLEDIWGWEGDEGGKIIVLVILEENGGDDVFTMDM